MVIVNFAHPITEEQKNRIGELAGRRVEQVRDVAAQFNEEGDYETQARTLVDAAGLSETEWQTLPLIVNLPSLNIIAALVIAEIHGRAGYFPAVLRLRPAVGGAVRTFEAAEIVNLQGVRDRARERRR